MTDYQMSQEKKLSKSIADNPATKELKSILPVMRAVRFIAGLVERAGIRKEAIHGFRAKIDEVVQQADILDLPDRFNNAFGAKGWIAVGSGLSVDVMKSALAFHDFGDHQAAEKQLVDWFTKENIELFVILRSRRFHVAHLRDDQLKEALNLYLEERYMAAVPLILIACDGFASDVSGISPFEKDADLSCFDSITGHPTSLPTLIKLVTKGIYRSRDDSMDIPQRHGILHGRALGYANKVTCAKAWLLMMALVDWAIAKSSEESRREEFNRNNNLTLKEVLEGASKVRAETRAMEAFRPYEAVGPFQKPFKPDGPEEAVFAFLSGWQAKNYGEMAQHAVNSLREPIKKMAGEMRNMASFVELEKFEVLKIRYSTVARCDVRVWVKAKTWRKYVEGEFALLMFRYTSEGEMAMSADQDSMWTVQQACIYNIMNEKYADGE